jgi:hypothetical protein
MRVNIIGNHGTATTIAQDTHILHGLLVHVFGDEIQVRHIPHYYPQCPQAEVNIFIDAITPSLFPYAAKNIWIPTPEWTQKTWEPYARMVDEVWCKTHEAMKLFEDWRCVKRYIGWTSIDKSFSETKNYQKAIAPVGRNVWRNPRPIIQTYMWIERNAPVLYPLLPELHIVYDSAAVPLPTLPPQVTQKIVLHAGAITEADYDALLKECGLCICLSATEGFGHAVNEALSTGCVMLLSPIDPFLEITKGKDVLWVSELKRTPNPYCLGDLYDVEQRSIFEALAAYVAGSPMWKAEYSQSMRAAYEANHAAFVERMSETLNETLSGIPEYSMEAGFPSEDALPSVSVITITRDRRVFMPLAKYCLLAQGYPEDKIEWVIVDDGTDQIKDLVSDLPNVKYILSDTPMTIGAKRNLAVEKASHDVLVMLDDDDVYPNNSILTRVVFMLTEPKKQCVFATTIPCFNIHEKKSFMNIPPIILAMADRVSEATLCFTREFWNQQAFPDQQIAEGGTFIRGREEMCREISPQDVIVSLVHKKNTSSRKAPPGEANGCHYGFSEDLYTLVSEIAESL